MAVAAGNRLWGLLLMVEEEALGGSLIEPLSLRRLGEGDGLPPAWPAVRTSAATATEGQQKGEEAEEEEEAAISQMMNVPIKDFQRTHSVRVAAAAAVVRQTVLTGTTGCH